MGAVRRLVGRRNGTRGRHGRAHPDGRRRHSDDLRHRRESAMSRLAAPSFALLFALAGCGTNRPEIPRELLVAPEGCGALEYPEGPYGTEPGSVAAELCF